MPQIRAATQQTSASAIYEMPLMMTSLPLQAPLLIRTRRRVDHPCSTSRRRYSTRRRHCNRTDCPTWTSSDHPFDRLPWISAMDVAPDPANMADIADLSQLTVDDDHVSTGAGPIRRRKTSLRSNPLAHDSHPHTPHPHNHNCRVEFHNLMPVLSCERPFAAD
ncbi:hypothetical protein MIND_01041800 [Mycena indigotica]|uniref:Uncharacterized protein n=1 Tax=Mycena indigotica TaxID=2126181 RepID=A0A8H6VX21_9AGAR|nr:uncharacterized protein MIND_01041800 [Mycena indigotica]KAF7295036.1 hypothetical protein MIND_01041800 [Mycena indigotica]